MSIQQLRLSVQGTLLSAPELSVLGRNFQTQDDKLAELAEAFIDNSIRNMSENSGGNFESLFGAAIRSISTINREVDNIIEYLSGEYEREHFLMCLRTKIRIREGKDPLQRFLALKDSMPVSQRTDELVDSLYGGLRD
ncbi:hypothetical protein [Thalassotalea mangrovi]|uniref:Uncharacterized protein n=1 Tax=Thalassotalea mangrovi TaxID=2572245 RepID=A0A4U1B271_9GAMM|nr:hypothetical protein [Thalassotalea mangrovi]TKB43553.1 hypothetical protein E8M12_14760 [Thalassotalea mangrovi]